MKHVFVETNWVVEYAAPVYLREPAALELARRAEAGELRLYIPSICLSEARHPVRKKFNPRGAADSVRSFLRWAVTARISDATEAGTVQVVLDKYEAAVRAELDQLDDRVRALRSQPEIEVFALDDATLARAVELSTEELDLKPFDQAILAAVLVRAERLRASGADDICFCELDTDLQPWDKYGRTKQPLTDFYDTAGVWVYGDFAMENPPKRHGFPRQ